MEKPLILPSDYQRIKRVQSFEELLSTPLDHGINALCWERSLEGDFNEISTNIGPIEEITTIEDSDLNSLDLSPEGKIARSQLITDQNLLRKAGLSPILDSIPAYPQDSNQTPFPTDVYSYHADSATIQADTYLCSYNIACSEGLRNEDAVKRVDIPETRAHLLDLYGGKDDDGFKTYLKEHFYDLHYLPAQGSSPFAFGFGNLWRIATEYPNSPVPPCVHRAPKTSPGALPRLLLIS